MCGGSTAYLGKGPLRAPLHPQRVTTQALSLIRASKTYRRFDHSQDLETCLSTCTEPCPNVRRLIARKERAFVPLPVDPPRPTSAVGSTRGWSLQAPPFNPAMATACRIDCTKAFAARGPCIRKCPVREFLLVRLSRRGRRQLSTGRKNPTSERFKECVSVGYTPAMKDSGLRIRIERELREKFLEICREQDRPAAQVLREFMRGFVAKNENAHAASAKEKRSK